MIYLFGAGVFIIIMIGVLGCAATIEEMQFRKEKILEEKRNNKLT